MTDQPDIRDIPSSCDYSLVLILATIFVGLAIFITYSRLDEIKLREEIPGTAERKDPKPVTTITTPDGAEMDEKAVLTRGFVDIVEIKLTEKDLNDYRVIKKYLEGVSDAKLPIETKYPYLKDDRNEYRVLSGIRDFTTYRNRVRSSAADDKSITVDWFISQDDAKPAGR